MYMYWILRQDKQISIAKTEMCQVKASYLVCICIEYFDPFVSCVTVVSRSGVSLVFI